MYVAAFFRPGTMQTTSTAPREMKVGYRRLCYIASDYPAFICDFVIGA